MRTYEVTTGRIRTTVPKAVLWHWRDSGGTWTLLEAAFTSYFLRKALFVTG